MIGQLFEHVDGEIDPIQYRAADAIATLRGGVAENEARGKVVLELALEGKVTVVEEPFTTADLWRASEVIVTATTADVMPVVSIDGRPVGDGRVGPIARRLGTAFRVRLERAGAGAAVL